MKTARACLIISATALLSANSASAAVYANLPSDTPFNLSLDTGASAWQNATATLRSASTTNNWLSTSIFTTAPQTISVDPLPGVPGTFDIVTQTTTTTYSNTSSNQSLNIGYSAGLAAPILVPEMYVLSGQINKKSGETLFSNGFGYLNFNMGMTISFADPYTPDTANGILTFKLGNAPGNWTYQYQTPFNTGYGSVSLANSQFLDLNNATFFEADYSIGGNAGVQFGVNDLNLNVSGNLNAPIITTQIGSVTSTTSLYHLDIPALPTAVPVPAAAYFLGSGLIGLFGIARKKQIWQVDIFGHGSGISVPEE